MPIYAEVQVQIASQTVVRITTNWALGAPLKHEKICLTISFDLVISTGGFESTLFFSMLVR